MHRLIKGIYSSGVFFPQNITTWGWGWDIVQGCLYLSLLFSRIMHQEGMRLRGI